MEKKYIKPTARNKMMDLLARRDHSEKELRKKLRERDYSAEEIDKALSYAIERNWLPDQKKLGERFAESLHKKLKGIKHINQYLIEKGLPKVSVDFDLELEKARQIMKNKFSGKLSTTAQKQKAGRFLVARGYTNDVVRKVIYEKN